LELPFAMLGLLEENLGLVFTKLEAPFTKLEFLEENLGFLFGL
jgi:hypothetical protein